MEHGIIGQFLIPGIAFLAVVAILGILRLAATNYIKVTPNEVAIVSGSRHKTQVTLPGKDGEPQTIVRGYKLVTGGAFFKIPIRDRVEIMELNLIQIPVLVNNVPAANGVLVSVKGIANIKILSDQASLALAVERFLGRKLEEVERVARENLESNLRAVVGTMTVEELIKDRNKLQTQITAEAGTDMAKMGLGVDIMNVQEISDANGYIEALGKARTAEVKRDATIGEAEAKRDADIRSAAARQAGQTAVAEADQAISDVNKAKDVRIAENNSLVQAQQARIPIIAAQAAAEEQKILNVKQVDAEQARIEAEVALQESAQRRHAAELDATLIVKANKDKEALVIAAQAEAEAAERKGEAVRIKLSKEGEGEQAKTTAVAVGRMKAADADQRELEARAAGKKADLLAVAEGLRQHGLAQATGVEAVGLAEAKAADAKAKAFAELDSKGVALMMLQLSPEAIKALGEAFSSAITPSANAIGQGLANIQELRMVDLGGSTAGGAGGNILNQFVNTPVQTLYGLVERIKATGMAPVFIKLAKDKLGMDVESIFAGAPNQPMSTPASAPKQGTAPTTGDDDEAAIS